MRARERRSRGAAHPLSEAVSSEKPGGRRADPVVALRNLRVRMVPGPGPVYSRATFAVSNT